MTKEIDKRSPSKANSEDGTMGRRQKTDPEQALQVDRYDEILADVTALLEDARHAAARSVNAVMTATYWAIGRRVVEHEQRGEERAGYGEALIIRLSKDLTERFGQPGPCCSGWPSWCLSTAAARRARAQPT